jgi:hypothetical protein
MRVILFQPQFADQVEARIKRQTIRQRARCKAGDELSLRKWSGLPYRSKQQTLGASVTCQSVQAVTISTAPWDRSDHHRLQVEVDGQIIPDADAFARADGFPSAALMHEWFDRTHGLPFNGEMITW